MVVLLDVQFIADDDADDEEDGIKRETRKVGPCRDLHAWIENSECRSSRNVRHVHDRQLMASPVRKPPIKDIARS